MIRPTLALAVASNRFVPEEDEWFDVPDELDQVQRALAAIDPIEAPIVAAALAGQRGVGSVNANRTSGVSMAICVHDRNSQGPGPRRPGSRRFWATVDDSACQDALVPADAMKPQPILLSKAKGIATVTLNRPERGNAWTGRMETAFRAAMADAEGDPGVGVIVITGAGRHFCVGADSRALEMSSEAGSYNSGIDALPAQPGNPDNPASRTRFGFVRALDKPVIAAVNGAAAGVGFVLMCFADIRFVASDAKLTAAAPRLGLPAECGVSWILPRLIGGSRATELLMSSRIILGDDAAAIGLAHESLPAEDVLPRATAYARTLVAECAPSSLKETKQQLALDLERSLLEADTDANERLLRMVGTDDFREGVLALTERRPPRFR